MNLLNFSGSLGVSLPFYLDRYFMMFKQCAENNDLKQFFPHFYRVFKMNFTGQHNV